MDQDFNDDLWNLFDNFNLDENAEVVALPEEKDKEVQLKCTNENCNSVEFDFDETNFICKNCGTLHSKMIDLGAEWRYYGCDDNKTNNPTRCGMPTNDFLPKSSLGSVIGMENMSKNFYQMSRARKYHIWNSMPYKERSLYNVINRLNSKASSGGISQSIIEDAKLMYKKLSETKISRGENRNGLIASSIYMSCKNNGVPRSAKEIATIFNLSITVMTRGCKKFHEILKMNVASTSPEDFIVRYCSKLKKPDIVEVCKYIVKKADEYSIVSENAPPSIAAGSIFLCCVEYKHNITKKEISKACEISEVTINKCYKKLVIYKDHILPKNPQDLLQK
jgi:transcription initiation factor TFIIB